MVTILFCMQNVTHVPHRAIETAFDVIYHPVIARLMRMKSHLPQPRVHAKHIRCVIF
jgi:hypothetical protein